ncbi:MAG TPA: hypothetical protein VN456_06835 [Desulfosporosinus sp.]|nr:hypothetical protein [Desulfosporosinus sp.]
MKSAALIVTPEIDLQGYAEETEGIRWFANQQGRELVLILHWSEMNLLDICNALSKNGIERMYVWGIKKMPDMKRIFAILVLCEELEIEVFSMFEDGVIKSDFIGEILRHDYSLNSDISSKS